MDCITTKNVPIGKLESLAFVPAKSIIIKQTIPIKIYSDKIQLHKALYFPDTNAWIHSMIIKKNISIYNFVIVNS